MDLLGPVSDRALPWTCSGRSPTEPRRRAFGLAHEIRCPVLMINGENDEGNPEHLARQLAERISSCTFEIWPGLGHPVHKEAPDAFHERVLAFLRACP